MTQLISLRQAATLCGKAESAISKALKSGKMKFVRKTPNGQGYMIDPAEALRIYPTKPSSFGANADHTQELMEKIADLRSERDHWKAEARDWKGQAQLLAHIVQTKAV